MTTCRQTWLVIGALVTLPASSAAQGAPEPPAPGGEATPAANSAANEVPKDPRGIKGISPFWETLKRGDSAFVARDFDTAITHYREAITKDPNNPLGHLRIAEAQMKQGQWAEAAQSVAAAIRFADRQPNLKAKGLFLDALLKERTKDYAGANAAWKTYQQFGQQQPKAKVHQSTPPERLKRVQVAKQMAEDYAAVKERIATRLKEAEDSAKKNAK